MKKINILAITSIILLIFSASFVLAESINTIEEQCSHWWEYPNCFNLGAGYSWCRYEKVDFDKEIETNNKIIENEKTLQTYCLCRNGKLIAKTNVLSQENSLETDSFIQTEVEKSSLTSSKDAETITSILYVPDFLIKYLKGEIQILKGWPPLY